MDKLRKRLEQVTGQVLNCSDPTSPDGTRLNEEMELLQELSKTFKLMENASIIDERISKRVRLLTDSILAPRSNGEAFEPSTYTVELKQAQSLIKMWNNTEGVEIKGTDADSAPRKSTKRWDDGEGSLTTKIKLTKKQTECLKLADAGLYDKFLALGGSGSGKSYVLAYKIIRDALRYKAPCLIARDKLVDLSQGLIDQIVPTILQQIAVANGQEKWDTWLIDGLKFAKFGERRGSVPSKMEFATGGYIRFAGLSKRDMSESGSDKILSPSWLHVMLEEISELDYEIVEKIITRLRYLVPNVLNQLLLCENPPSVNHWSYRRFIEGKREDNSNISEEEARTMRWLLMNPQDNVENLGETYIRNLSQMSGANYERFYLGQFQDSETGEIFKQMKWVESLPSGSEWEKLIIYTDPTPLTGKDHSPWADYKASVLCGLFDGDTYVIDVRLVKGSTLEMLRNIKALWDMSPNKEMTHVVMEKRQVPSDFQQVLKSFSEMTQWVCPIRMDTRTFGDKKGSIETFLQPLFENNMIFFNQKFRDTERGRQAQVQILKFSRKANKAIHDDIPDAIMRADTYMKGRQAKRIGMKQAKQRVFFEKPAYVHKNLIG